MTSTTVELKSPMFACPVCGCSRLSELTFCVVLHRVTKWSASGEPLEYESPEVDWESDLPYRTFAGEGRTLRPTYECSRCGKQFETPSQNEAIE